MQGGSCKAILSFANDHEVVKAVLQNVHQEFVKMPFFVTGLTLSEGRGVARHFEVAMELPLSFCRDVNVINILTNNEFNIQIICQPTVHSSDDTSILYGRVLGITSMSLDSDKLQFSLGITPHKEECNI